MLTNPSPSDGEAIKACRRRVIASTKFALLLMKEFDRKRVLSLLGKIDEDNLLGNHEEEIVEEQSNEEGDKSYEFVITKTLKRKNGSDSSITSETPDKFGGN